MRYSALFSLLIVVSNTAGATNCTAYAIGALGPSGLEKFIRIAAPAGSRNIKLTLEARPESGGWRACPMPPVAEASCAGIPGVGYHAMTSYPTAILHETGVAQAWVGTFANQSGSKAEYRLNVNYDWDQPNCRAIAWDRLEHNVLNLASAGHYDRQFFHD